MNSSFQHRQESSALLRERDLADRWQTSQRTLQRWRSERTGPPFMRIGGAIRYRLDDIESYEERMRRGIAIDQSDNAP